LDSAQDVLGRKRQGEGLLSFNTEHTERLSDLHVESPVHTEGTEVRLYTATKVVVHSAIAAVYDRRWALVERRYNSCPSV
jgi:hypothetical protein